MGNYPFTFDSYRPLDVFGVPGRLVARTTKPGGEAGQLWTRQRWVSERRPVRGYGAGAEISAEIRFDDDCNNGHNTFAITGEITTPASRRRGDIEAGGCIHDEIARAFPGLAPLIRWHLCSTDGPMHYVANAVYMAGDRDHRGLRAGEQKPLVGPDGVGFWELVATSPSAAALKDNYPELAGVPGAPLYALKTSHKGDNPPAAPGLAWRRQMLTGEGKARDLDAARRIAVWPEATDAELCQPRDVLKAALEARLPGLLAAFRADMEAAGLIWAPSEFPQPAA